MPKKTKDGESLGVVTGTFCPLDGSMHLSAVEWHGQVWLYCPLGATGPGDAHTAYPIKEYRPTRDEIETVAILAEPMSLPPISSTEENI